MNVDTKYPYLEQVSQQSKVAKETLLAVYEMESDFYKKIMSENSFEARQKLYEYVYTKIGEILPTDLSAYFKARIPIKTRIAKCFRKEIENKSLLDVGCGDGTFLYSLSATGIKVASLYGLDIKPPSFPNDEISKKINCYQRNIIKFEVPQKFDTLILDNVYEHIAPQDKAFFLTSLTNSISPNGKIIMIIPHRGFGPTDFTKIIDNTFTGKLASHCVHLNETTFTDVIADLKAFGFSDFQTNIPFIAFAKIRDWFPNLRLPASLFAYLENSSFWMRIFRAIKYKGRALFRMEVVIIATASK